MAVSSPTLHLDETLGSVAGAFVSATMSGGIGSPDQNYDVTSPFLGLTCRVMIWEDVAAGSYTIAQDYATTDPSTTSSFSATGGSGSRIIFVTGDKDAAMWGFVIEVTGAGTVDTPTEVSGDATGASNNITTTSGGRAFAFMASNWDPTPNQTAIAESVITGTNRLAGQHAAGTGGSVAMNFTGSVDQVAYIGFNVQEGGAPPTLGFDEDYQLFLPVQSGW